MASNEEIKAFLNNEKNAEAIAKDEAFLDAVSGGTIDVDVMAKKFESLGLELDKEDVESIKKTAIEAAALPSKKLENIDLQKISGGLSSEKAIEFGRDLGFVTGVTSAIGGLGCWIAKTACKVKARKAAEKGNLNKANDLNKTAHYLDVITGAALGTTVASLGVSAGLGTTHEIKKGHN